MGEGRGTGREEEGGRGEFCGLTHDQRAGRRGPTAAAGAEPFVTADGEVMGTNSCFHRRPDRS